MVVLWSGVASHTPYHPPSSGLGTGRLPRGFPGRGMLLYVYIYLLICFALCLPVMFILSLCSGICVLLCFVPVKPVSLKYADDIHIVADAAENQ